MKKEIKTKTLLAYLVVCIILISVWFALFYQKQSVHTGNYPVPCNLTNQTIEGRLDTQCFQYVPTIKTVLDNGTYIETTKNETLSCGMGIYGNIDYTSTNNDKIIISGEYKLLSVEHSVIFRDSLKIPDNFFALDKENNTIFVNETFINNLFNSFSNDIIVRSSVYVEGEKCI